MSLNKLKKATIDIRFAKKIRQEKYTKQKKIEGVKIISLSQIQTEDGYFLEVLKLSNDSSLKAFPDFRPKQISYSLIDPGSVKAWHIHFQQDDIWFVPPEKRLLVGLYDLRGDSGTKGEVMRLILGGNPCSLLYIPKGVAHGCSNTSNSPIGLLYLTNSHFKRNDPDEYRLPWDFLGDDFWKIKKG